MADAKKCDRCGGYYEERETDAFEELTKALKSMVYPESKSYRISKIFDFCPACEKSFEKWWKEGE